MLETPPAEAVVPEPTSESPGETPSPPSSTSHAHHNPRTAALALAALGVVYGDIGTSPLYAVRESLNPAHHVAVDQAANVMG